MFAGCRDTLVRLHESWNWHLRRIDKAPVALRPPGSRTLSHRFSVILHNSLGTNGLPELVRPRLWSILRSKKGT